MSFVATAIIGTAVVGAGASYLSAKSQSKAIDKATMTQMFAQQSALEQAQYAADVAAGAQIEAAAMMAEATTGAARINAKAAKDAADKQLIAAREALALQEKEWAKMQENMKPYLAAGGAGLNQLAYGIGLPGYEGTGEAGYLQKAFSEQDFAKDFQTSPGYEFRLSEGIKALDRTASANGNLLSGQQLKGVTRFGQEYASNEYANAYARAYGSFVQNQDSQYNHLANMANMGQNTAVQMGNAGMNYATGYGNTLLGATSAANNYNVNAANQNAAAAIAAAQAQGTGLTNAANIQQNMANLAGQYGINSASILGNAGIAKANANASAYTGIANIFSNALGQYYGYKGYGGGYNPASYGNSLTPSPYQTNYGSYTL